MMVHLVTTAIFWLNYSPPSKPGAGLYNTKIPGNFFLRTIVDYNNFCRLQPGEYVQIHQEYEPWNTIAIDQTVIAIILEPQYNLQGGFFKRLLTGKLLRCSHWTPVNMT